MAVVITYNNEEIATVANETKTLKTGNTYCDYDIVVTDSSSPSGTITLTENNPTGVNVAPYETAIVAVPIEIEGLDETELLELANLIDQGGDIDNGQKS